MIKKRMKTKIRMKMKFWQKIFISTLLLFLICLYTGVFSLAYYTYTKNLAAVEEICISEQFYIAKSFKQDLDRFLSKGDTALSLMELYGDYYKKIGINLAFWRDGEIIYSTLPENIRLGDISSGDTVIWQQKIDGVRYSAITSPLTVNDNSYVLIYSKDISSVDRDWSKLVVVFLITTIAISSVFAFLLYLVLKKLSAPLEKLRKTTEIIAQGNYNTLADITGHDEFSELAQSFNKMVTQINNQIKTLKLNAVQKQKLVDNLAHELRTPLTTIHGYAEYLQRAAVSQEELVSSTEYIMSEAERLQKISDRLLDMAFIRNNEISKEEVPVPALFDDVLMRMNLKLKDKRINLTRNIENVRISGDCILLQIMFTNLLDNAIKACNMDGRIEVSAFSEEGGVTISISDNGKGITREELAHITEPFYRTDKSRSRSEGGVGLGLSLCKQIADAHEAEMTFFSVPASGTKVTVNFTT